MFRGNLSIWVKGFEISWKRRGISISFLVFSHVKVWWEGGCLHTRRKALPGESVVDKLIFSLQNWEEINFSCLSHSSYSI